MIRPEIISFPSHHLSQPFHPLLAGAFFRAGYIESWGRSPAYDFETAGVSVQRTANPDHLRGDNEVAGTTPKTTPITTSNETSDRILSLMRDTPTISLQELSDVLDMTRDGVKYHYSTPYQRRFQLGMHSHIAELRQPGAGVRAKYRYSACRDHSNRLQLGPE